MPRRLTFVFLGIAQAGGLEGCKPSKSLLFLPHTTAGKRVFVGKAAPSSHPFAYVLLWKKSNLYRRTNSSKTLGQSLAKQMRQRKYARDSGPEWPVPAVQTTAARTRWQLCRMEVVRKM